MCFLYCFGNIMASETETGMKMSASEGQKTKRVGPTSEVGPKRPILWPNPPLTPVAVWVPFFSLRKKESPNSKRQLFPPAQAVYSKFIPYFIPKRFLPY